MARRASSGVNIGQIAGIAVAILGFLVVAALLFKLIAGDLMGGGSTGKKGGSGNSNATLLNLATFRENANSLRGNIYRIEGKVEETLRWTSDRGRLISFDANDTIISIPVPVRVPEDFSNVNIERGSSMSLVVRVDREGTLVVESIDD